MKGPLPGRPVPIQSDDPHVPVLIEAILRECAPVTGVWLDGTLGAGGYTRAHGLEPDLFVLGKPVAGGDLVLILDEVAMAAGKEYFRLAELSVSPNGKAMLPPLVTASVCVMPTMPALAAA